VIGKGKYDEFAEGCLLATGAQGVLVLVIHGDKGSGFSASFTNPEMVARIPAALREMANTIEADAKRLPAN
jgi:hypothetical protein